MSVGVYWGTVYTALFTYVRAKELLIQTHSLKYSMDSNNIEANSVQ